MPPKEKELKIKAVSYRSRDKIVCKICETDHNPEQLHTGGGRLIAGRLTAELRRLYEANKRYGKIYPAAYSILTCPQCLYSGFPIDFNNLHHDDVEKLQKQTLERRTGIEKIVGPVNFKEDRNLVLGAASYILAINCYQVRGRAVAPTPKKALCSLRAAWLFNDMHEEFPGMGFDKLREFLYNKTVHYYSLTLDIMSTGKEPHDQFVNLLGPDTDQNWGFDGVVYLNGYFTSRMLDRLADTTEKKIELLDRSKRYLGKLYGLGRSSKTKPSVLINLAKDLYEQISKQMDEFRGD